MLITIIINNYNYGQFVGAAIESALSQTHPEIEVIVVDDGSTDDSPAIIRRYGDRIHAILQPNGGQASAFNAGFAASTGAAVIFLDADDLLLPQAAERVAATFAANPGLSKVMYRMAVVDMQGQLTGQLKPHQHLPLLDGDLRRYVLSFPFDIPWMATSGNAFSASALRAIFPIPVEEYGRIGADWYVAHLTPLFGSVAFLNELGAYYRVHDRNLHETTVQTMSLSQLRQTIQYAQVTERYIGLFAERRDLWRMLKIPRGVHSVSLMANRLISLRLDPTHHPISGDTRSKLWRLGVRSAVRRFDVSFTMKSMFVVWFSAMAIAPIRVATWLAMKWLFPETRNYWNMLLAHLHVARS